MHDRVMFLLGKHTQTHLQKHADFGQLESHFKVNQDLYALIPTIEAPSDTKLYLTKGKPYRN